MNAVIAGDLFPSFKGRGGREESRCRLEMNMWLKRRCMHQPDGWGWSLGSHILAGRVSFRCRQRDLSSGDSFAAAGIPWPPSCSRARGCPRLPTQRGRHGGHVESRATVTQLQAAKALTDSDSSPGKGKRVLGWIRDCRSNAIEKLVLLTVFESFPRLLWTLR